jgi:hypothetical protein
MHVRKEKCIECCDGKPRKEREFLEDLVADVRIL